MKYVSFLLIPFLFGHGTANAEESSLSRSDAGLETSVNSLSPSRIGLLGGVGYGMSGLKSSDLTGATGSEFQASLLVSAQWKQWVIDLGGGWYRTEIQGGIEDGLSRRYKTDALFAELSPRYRLGEHWQLGPVLDLKFGTQFQYGTGSSPTESRMLPMAGLKIVYALPVKTADLRFVGKPVIDVSLPGRALYAVMGGIEFGFSTSPSVSSPTRVAPQPIVEVVKTSQAAPLIFSVPSESVHFKTGSDELSPDSRKFLVALGRSISKNLQSWRELEITGHTDIRGTHAGNQVLSEKRAASVRAALLEGKVPAERLKIEGRAETQPVDGSASTAAWRKNRRVELVFQGVTDREAVMSAMSPQHE